MLPARPSRPALFDNLDDSSRLLVRSLVEGLAVSRMPFGVIALRRCARGARRGGLRKWARQSRAGTHTNLSACVPFRVFASSRFEIGHFGGVPLALPVPSGRESRTLAKPVALCAESHREARANLVPFEEASSPSGGVARPESQSANSARASWASSTTPSPIAPQRHESSIIPRICVARATPRNLDRRSTRAV
jgi:hypothetical protein